MAFENLKSTGIAYLLTKLKSVFLQIADAVRTVNGIGPDANGDIGISVIPYAQNLESETTKRNTDTFLQRMSGGESSINDGDAWLVSVKGNNVHTGYTPESIQMTVNGDNITAALDRDDFVAAMSGSGTLTLSYTTEWSADPAAYGITVSGTPTNGDSIVVVYVAEVRGTITVASPSKFTTTGWNLYDHTAGYARVVKYGHGYRISGSYSSLKYSATLNGSRSTVKVTSRMFDVPADGFVWVTGGNGTTTAIYPTWEDWTGGYEGDWAAYSADEVDFSSIMSTYFPNGLMKAGNVVDEIDLNLNQAIVRVERLSYTAENLAAAQASGREFEYDENYIYLAKATATANTITINGEVTANDHGIEFFSGTDVPVALEIIYGTNLKNKLERDVLTVSEQALTAEQQQQVKQNLGISAYDIAVRSVAVPYPATFEPATSYHTNLKTIIDADLPAGKKCVGIAGFDSGGGMIVIVQVRYANSSYSFQAANFASAAYSNKSASIMYLCVDA